MENINISTVAEKAGVSRTTVSRVINDSKLVKGSTASLVRQVIAELGYEPNELARGLRISETKTIGVIVSNVLNPFFTSIVRGIEDIASAANYNIMLCNTDEEPEKEKQYIQALVGKQVDGLIIASTDTKDSYFSLAKGKPIVFVDRKPEGINHRMFDTVLVENREGSYQAVKHLLESGYRNIGIITGPSKSTIGYDRLLGYQEALKDAGIKIEKKLIKYSDFLGHTGYRYAKELMTQTNCDAIFAANNIILLGILRAASELGIKIPKDMGLVSFDDMEWMQYCQPSITAVKQPTYKMGTTAMELLLDRISGTHREPVEAVLGVELIPRDTSRR